MSVSRNTYSSLAAQEMPQYTEHGRFDIIYDAYVRSKMGTDSETNCDNFYLNGIFVKSFKFTDMKKSLDGVGKNSVFVVCSGIKNDYASKLVLRYIDQKREWLTASKTITMAKKRLSMVMEGCNSFLLEQSKRDNEDYETAICAALYFESVIIYAICGDIGMIMIKNNHVKKLSCKNIGLGKVTGVKIKTGLLSYNKDDKLILYSCGIASEASAESIGIEAFNKEDVNDIVKHIIYNVSFIGNKDRTCMVINAEPPNQLRTGTLIIAGISLLITLFNIYLLLM